MKIFLCQLVYFIDIIVQRTHTEYCVCVSRSSRDAGGGAGGAAGGGRRQGGEPEL